LNPTVLPSRRRRRRCRRCLAPSCHSLRTFKEKIKSYMGFC
jgi:hypothetical protein